MNLHSHKNKDHTNNGFIHLRILEIHLFYHLLLFYWHFLEILWLFIFIVFYKYYEHFLLIYSSTSHSHILQFLYPLSYPNIPLSFI